LSRQVVDGLIDLAWCVAFGVAFGRLDLARLCAYAPLPETTRRLIPALAAAIIGLVPIAISAYMFPGPTLPVVVALFTLASHLSTKRRGTVLWLLFGASAGLGLWVLAAALAQLAWLAPRLPQRTLVMVSAPVLAAAGGVAWLHYGEDIHLLWAAVVVLTSVAYLARFHLRRQRPWLLRRRTIGVACAILGVVLLGTYVQVGRAGFHRATFCEQLVSGPPNSGLVALTFDDGPDPVHTPEVLRVLREAGVQATFFMVGSKVQAYPEIARQVVAEGHTVGNHSYTHRDMGRMSRLMLALEIDRTQLIIEEVCGVMPVLFRPPRGVTSAAMFELLAERQMVLVLWSLSSRDWMQLPPSGIVAAMARRARPGDVLLFHDSGDYVRAAGASRLATIRALPGVISALQARGLAFATIDEVLCLARETGWTGTAPAGGRGLPADSVEGRENMAAGGVSPDPDGQGR